MSNASATAVSNRKSHPIHNRRLQGRLHNFGRGSRWIVRPDGETYGDYISSHDSLARRAGYKNEEHAYAKGALRVHYDPATNALRIEAIRATPRAIALAKQIIDQVPAGLAHVAIGEGEEFRAYIGEPGRVAALISRKEFAPSDFHIPNPAYAGAA